MTETFIDLSNNRTSLLVQDQLPEFITTNYPNFVAFVEAYYQYLEQNGKLTNVTKNFPNFLNIDYVIENNLTDFINSFCETYLNNIPSNILADKAKLLKHIKTFYSSRGTDKSFKFLWRILFNEDVELFDTGTQVLKLSDGKWHQPQVIRIQTSDGSSDLSKWLNLEIFGETSYATAIVENFNYNNQIDNLPCQELEISHLTKNFVTGETITANTGTKTLTGTVIGVLHAITVTNGGSTYNVGDYVPISGGSGNGANAQIVAVSSGSLTEILPMDGGAGFQVYPNFQLNITNSLTPVMAEIVQVDTSGTLQPNTYLINDNLILNVSNNVLGNSWNTQINQTFNSYVTYANTGPISFIAIISGGSFTKKPGISISQNTKIGNSNTTILQYGSIGTFKIIQPGINYTVNDTIIFTNITSRGFGAEGIISSVNANGSITGALVTLPSISGTANVIAGSNVITGTSTVFTTQLTANNLANTPGAGTYIVINGEQKRVITIANDTSLNVDTNFINTANNQKIRLSGYMLGGTGYTQSDIINKALTTSIITNSGSGGSVYPDSVLGDGAILNSSQGTYGIIQKISVIKFGSNYAPTNPPTIDLTNLGDGTANAVPVILGGVYSYPGYYLNEDGLLSSRRYLQDMFKYNNYSYQIISPVLTQSYRDLVYNILNPAGMNMLTITELNSQTNSIMVITNPTNSYFAINGVYLLDLNFVLNSAPLS